MNLRDAENTPLWQCLYPAQDCPSNNSDISEWSLTWLWEDLQWHEQMDLRIITPLPGCFPLPLYSQCYSVFALKTHVLKNVAPIFMALWHSDCIPLLDTSNSVIRMKITWKPLFCPKIASRREKLKLLGTEDNPSELICLFKNNTFWKCNQWFQQTHIKYFRKKILTFQYIPSF